MPVQHRFIASSSKCTAKQLSSLLTKILTVIKTGLEKNHIVKTSHTGVNNMWILKNSTNLLSSLVHLGVHKITSIQTFEFSTLYTFMSSNIPTAPAYRVYASQLIRYARCCSNYSDFLSRHRALVTRLLSQG